MSMVKDTWRFLDTGKGSALFNMALDEAVFLAVSKGESPPTIRVFEWCPEAITLGYAQRMHDVIDYERCVEEGVDVTRRPTGGRAVYHKNEIAYSVAGPVTNQYFGGNILETYRAISTVLCEGINDLGVAAVLSRGTVDTASEVQSLKSEVQSSKSKVRNVGANRESPVQTLKSEVRNPNKVHTPGSVSPCFSSTSRYEITVNGKKLVGSAQRRFKDYFLQQGSILTGPGYEKITDFIVDRTLALHLRRLLLKHSIDLATIMEGSFTIESLKTSLRDAFQKKIKLNLDARVPTDAEFTCARRLARERYGSKGWVMYHER